MRTRLTRSVAYCFCIAAAAGCGSDDGEKSPSSMGSAGTAAAAGAAAAGTSAQPAPAGTGTTATAGTSGSPATTGRGPTPPARGTAGASPAPAANSGGAGAPATPAAGSGSGSAGMAAAPMPPAGPPGTWPAADPGKMGPYMTVTENNVGPNMAFTMFRPMELTQRHPVITWGNGTSTMPSTYAGMLRLYASHGFIVIASNSPNVGQGNPPPMLNGVTWVLEQDMTEGTALYQKVDRENIGATGHSQGAFATSSAGSDPRIKTIAPIQVLGTNRGLHGPILALCGTMDTTLPCSRNLSAYNNVSDLPVMYGELKSASHSNWIGGRGMVNPYHMITTAWFRVHLMNDTALRPMFYGDCSICKDEATWVTMRKNMD